MRWNTPARDHRIVVWWAQLDERYLVEVRRAGEYRGVLLLFDHDRDDQFVYAESVQLRLGARIGPSIEDLSDWEGRAERFVDATHGTPSTPAGMGGQDSGGRQPK